MPKKKRRNRPAPARAPAPSRAPAPAPAPVAATGGEEQPHETEKREAEERRAKTKADQEANENRYGDYIKSTCKKIETNVCWAVAMAETVEAHRNKLTTVENHVELSPRFMIDSIESPHASKASFRRAAKLLKESGLPLESKYPWLGPAPCLPQNVKSKMTIITGEQELDKKNGEITAEEAMKHFEEHGPLVAVFYTDYSVDYLKPGEIYTPQPEVFNAAGKSSWALHGKSNDGEFWTVRNSYGENWCNKGIGRFSRSMEITKIWFPEGIKKL